MVARCRGPPDQEHAGLRPHVALMLRISRTIRSTQVDAKSVRKGRRIHCRGIRGA